MTNKNQMEYSDGVHQLIGGKFVAEESVDYPLTVTTKEVPNILVNVIQDQKRGRGRPAKYPWATIDIGESFDAPTISTVGMKSASKRLNRTFVIDQLTDDVVKITRIE